MVRACLPSAADDVIARVQRLADGIPFLVEESLAAPGVPRSFADGVRSRLAGLSGGAAGTAHRRAARAAVRLAAAAAATGLAAESSPRAGTRCGSQLLAVRRRPSGSGTC